MKIKAILFDLDGTLLPMDLDVFVKSYMKRLAAHLAPHGYEPERLSGAIWQGTAAMVKNCGDRTNEEVFWDFFAQALGERVREDAPLLEDFYRNEFCHVRESCEPTHRAAEILRLVRELGLRAVLATNPIFPAVATEQRIAWAGLRLEDFEHITTYENSRRAKPNPDYYRDILAHIGLSPEECLMVGNDVGEDMIARELGMQVFLLTDCLINKVGADVSQYPHGGFDELAEHIRSFRELV